MHGVLCLRLAILGLASGAGVAADAAREADDILAFLEYLGDEATTGDEWDAFLDSLSPGPDDTTPLVTGPMVVEEPRL